MKNHINVSKEGVLVGEVYFINHSETNEIWKDAGYYFYSASTYTRTFLGYSHAVSMAILEKILG